MLRLYIPTSFTKTHYRPPVTLSLIKTTVHLSVRLCHLLLVIQSLRAFCWWSKSQDSFCRRTSKADANVKWLNWRFIRRFHTTFTCPEQKYGAGSYDFLLLNWMLWLSFITYSSNKELLFFDSERLPLMKKSLSLLKEAFLYCKTWWKGATQSNVYSQSNYTGINYLNKT